MEILETLGSMLDQYKYYSDVKMPDLSSFQKLKRVIVCGMGGSAFPVEIVSDHIKELYKRDIISINRDYQLPYYADDETLIIACSFSGSTEETLACMKEAMDRKLPLIGVSMGGEISRICSEQKIPYVSLPKILMPRFGTGYVVSSILRILVETKFIPAQDEEIGNVSTVLAPILINIQKTTESLAKSLKDRFILIYTDTQNEAAGKIAKICINETAKVTAFNNVFSESNHNELASHEHLPYATSMIMLTNPKMHSRIIKRFDLLKTVLEDRDINYQKVNSNFESILYRDIHYSIFFSYLAYYLAIECGHDPVNTPNQDLMKKLLKSFR